ncbi:2OG-Fe(II) oxygenase superfamily domain-containing protein [Phthorimaea operculella]|nr:2OG-Fe(II) oxygenase superfamily domain-containing protein [Phthorimaea operculella]
MTANDCYVIGKILYEMKWIRNGIEWFIEALRLCEREKKSLDLTKMILHDISKGYRELNDSTQYVIWTKRLLESKPDFDEETIRDLEVMVDVHQLRINEATMGRQSEQETSETQEKMTPSKEETRKAFRALCRNEMVVPHDVGKRLKCWYFEGHHQFCTIARFKAEQLFLDPDVLLIHDAISDAEIQTIKDIALPELEIVPIDDDDENTTMFNNPSKKMTFDRHQSVSISKVTQRVSDMTGLWAELQLLTVSNYGVGGHYVPHLDSTDLMEEEEIVKYLKSKYQLKRLTKQFLHFQKTRMLHFFRIATVLFYLSDVEQGGATVFPFLGLSVFPVKGAALVWTNLLPTGKSDLNLVHGACPVLRGSKWVATKWIDAKNQELRKLCLKNYTIEDLSNYKPFKPTLRKSLYSLE